MINPQRIANRIKRLMPGQESVTLQLRTSAEGFTATTEQARRKPATLDTITMMGGDLGQTWLTFEFFAPSQTPTELGTITDGNGISYQIKSAKKKMVANIHDCLVVRNK